MPKRRTRGWIKDVLGLGFGRTDDGKGFGEHALETRVRVQVDRGHETYIYIQGHGMMAR